MGGSWTSRARRPTRSSTGSDPSGRFAHTNHYACARMLGVRGRSRLRRPIRGQARPGQGAARRSRGREHRRRLAPGGPGRPCDRAVDLSPPGVGQPGRDGVLVHRRRHGRRDPVRPGQPLRARRGAVLVRLTRLSSCPQDHDLHVNVKVVVQSGGYAHAHACPPRPMRPTDAPCSASRKSPPRPA